MMNEWEFKALVLAQELNLNRLASHFEINKKYRWEDPLVLSDQHLEHLILPKEKRTRFIYIYFFGAVVFINFSSEEIHAFVQYLKNITSNQELKASDTYSYIESYTLQEGEEKDFSVSNDGLTVHQFKNYYLYIISLILAKSISLRKIELDMNKIFDEVEQIVELMEKGRFVLRDKSLAKMAAKILRFRYTSLSYLMLLDEPDIVWENDEAATLYRDLNNLFELKDRYLNIKHKSDTLLNITDVFSNVSNTIRSVRLEWGVIILIAFEIILNLVEMYFK